MSYNPNLHTLTAKAIGFSQANPADARSFYYDDVNDVYRHYASTAEVILYLDFPEFRVGNFPIWVNVTGTIQPDGTMTGGDPVQFMFVVGTEDGDLIEFASGGVKAFVLKTDFPVTGKEGFIYISKNDDAEYYWDGLTYVQLTSVHVFNNFAAFPATGNVGFLYIAKDTGAQYYFAGSTYTQIGGGVFAFANRAAFPSVGNAAFIYISKDDDAEYYWDGSTYVQLTSIQLFTNAAAFPVAGNTGFLYIDKATGLTYYWNGSAYVASAANVDATKFIQNQNAAAQAANFWITGNGIANNLYAVKHSFPSTPDMFVTSDGLQLMLDCWTGSRGFSFRVSGAEFAHFLRGAAGESNYLFRIVGAFDLQNGYLPYGVGLNWGSINVYQGGNPAGWNQLRIKGYDANPTSDPRWSLAHKIVLFHPNTGVSGDQDSVKGVGIGSNTTHLHFSVPDNGGFVYYGGPVLPTQSTTDLAVQNGGLMFRTDTQKLRVALNGFWKNVATEDSTYLSGNVISVDQSCVSATDVRTGLSKYSQSIPFKTINGAMAVASDGDLVYVHSGVYTEDVILDPRSFSGWVYFQIALDGVTINGDVHVTTLNNEMCSVFGVGGRQSVINGKIYGLGGFKITYFKDLTVRDGIYGISDANFVVDNCDITFAQAYPFSFNGTVKNSKLTLNAYPGDYSFKGTVRYNNCEIVSASTLITYNDRAGDLIFENCRLKINGALLQNDDRGGMRILIRNSRVSFTNWIAPAGNTTPFSLVIHDSQLIALTPATDVLTNPAGGVPAHIELVGTVRNCATGTVPTVTANDVQASSLTEF
jgi:hypothetical protein